MENQPTPIMRCQHFISSLQTDFEKRITEDIKMSFEKESLFAIQLLQKNDFLVSTAVKNPESLKNAILNVASIGISLNPAKKSAYLVPRDGAVMLDISYMGMAEIATSMESIDFVQAKLVHENDTFEYLGVSSEPDHKFNPFGDRGQVIGVYCVTKTAKGDFLTEMMTIQECLSIRDRTKIWQKKQSGPWKTDQGEMMKKTVIKRAAKLWPRVDLHSQRIESVIDVMNESEGIDFEKERAEALERQEERVSIEYNKKLSLVAEIKDYCALLMKDATLEEKGEFISKNLEVSKFPDLIRKTEVQLEQIIENLKDL